MSDPRSTQTPATRARATQTRSTQTPAPVSARIARALRALHPTPRRAPTSLAQHVEYLERDVQEVRTRVNALFFAVLTAAVAPLIVRLFG